MENKLILQPWGIGQVAKDILEDEFYVDIYPIELHPNKAGEVTTQDTLDGVVNDISGNVESIIVMKSSLIKAKWLADSDTNRLEPPTVCRGETVKLYRADTGRYYWVPLFNELHLRKLEKRTIILSNKRTIGAKGDSLLKKAYYLTVDTINKYLRLHTDDSDGEYTTYDIEINTKDGTFILVDGKGNTIVIDSQTDSILTSVLNEMVNKSKYTINTISVDKTETIGNHHGVSLKTYSVTNGEDELIALAMETIQAMHDAIGIGNLGFPVPMDDATKAVFKDLKDRYGKFQK